MSGAALVPLRETSPVALNACITAWTGSRPPGEPPFEGDMPHAWLQFTLPRDAAKADAQAVALVDDSGVAGVCVVRLPAWDREHFGFAAGRVEHLFGRDAGMLARLVGWADGVFGQAGAGFASARVAADDLPAIHALETAGYRFQELVLHPWMDLRQWQPRDEGLCRFARPEDEAALRSIAASSFRADRFHNDPRFTHAQADGLYVRWVESAFHDDSPGARIVVLELEGEPAGFVTGEVEADRGPGLATIWRIGLAAMHPSWTDRGHGHHLYFGVFDLAKAEADFAPGPVAARNTAEIRLHPKVGTRITSGGEVTLHRWFSGPRAVPQ
jgi:hypothetical protein